jgi:hypothetical protein
MTEAWRGQLGTTVVLAEKGRAVVGGESWILRLCHIGQSAAGANGYSAVTASANDSTATPTPQRSSSKPDVYPPIAVPELKLYINNPVAGFARCLNLSLENSSIRADPLRHTVSPRNLSKVVAAFLFLTSKTYY